MLARSLWQVSFPLYTQPKEKVKVRNGWCLRFHITLQLRFLCHIVYHPTFLLDSGREGRVSVPTSLNSSLRWIIKLQSRFIQEVRSRKQGQEILNIVVLRREFRVL